ncbi:MAG: hypothetical protein MUF45_15650 [Spirosomaceae bacterium]|jgi:hypothetical protein|nr:hypothetical protein [Spirosomataceae bacterium]
METITIHKKAGQKTIELPDYLIDKEVDLNISFVEELNQKKEIREKQLADLKNMFGIFKDSDYELDEDEMYK